jgi:CheY-like chemotaxis protein
MISGQPNVLVVDDDPVSLAFLRAAIERCGCAVACAADGRAALDEAGRRSFDLFIIDRGLPDIDGPGLLRGLRARGLTAPAIATSAEIGPVDSAALTAAGFSATLAKPLSLEALQEMLRGFVAIATPVATPDARPAAEPGIAVLDDTPALEALGGDHVALAALRGLFAVELEALRADLPADAALPGRLHRLRASCGFCGAIALSAAAARYEAALRDGRSDVGVRRSEFLDACSRTARALVETAGEA